MPRFKPSEDVRPLSEVRANIAAVVEHVQGTRRPVVLTQRGRSAAVLVDVESYEALLEEVELLRDVRAAESEVARGAGVPHADARARVHASLGGRARARKRG